MSLELSLEHCSVSGLINVSRQWGPCSWTRDGERALTQFSYLSFLYICVLPFVFQVVWHSVWCWASWEIQVGSRSCDQPGYRPMPTDCGQLWSPSRSISFQLHLIVWLIHGKYCSFIIELKLEINLNLVVTLPSLSEWRYCGRWRLCVCVCGCRQLWSSSRSISFQLHLIVWYNPWEISNLYRRI